MFAKSKGEVTILPLETPLW